MNKEDDLNNSWTTQNKTKEHNIVLTQYYRRKYARKCREREIGGLHVLPYCSSNPLHRQHLRQESTELQLLAQRRSGTTRLHIPASLHLAFNVIGTSIVFLYARGFASLVRAYLTALPVTYGGA